MSACSARVKTCQTCATAKIRCLRSPNSPICDRCLRLNKPCYFRPARIRQTWSRKETRLELLERRVDQLLGQSSQSHSPSEVKAGDVIDKGLLSLDEAAALLASFLQFMMPDFPFVVLPATTTADQLRQSAPFLFLAILSVSVTNDLTLKRALDEEVRAALAERTVFMHQPPTLETLQGLLIVLAWTQHQVRQRSSPRHFPTYLHLAIGLIVTWRLDQPIEMRRRQTRRVNISEEDITDGPPETLRAEQRAAIGCSLLSSCSVIITQERCTFPWAPELEAFAVGLAENPEYDSDQTIIHFVRLQHVLEEIDRVSRDPNSFETGHSGRAFHHSFRTFKARIQEYSNLLPPRLASNFTLSTQLHTINLYLCQVSLFDRKATSQLPVDVRAEILCHGLAAAKSFFTSLASIEPGAERRFSYSQWLQSGFNLIVSCKLALMAVSDEALRDSFPQVQTLCDELDMPQVLRICVVRQDQHSSYSGAAPPATGFDYKGWLQWIEEWFLRQYNGYIARREAAGRAVTAASSTPVDPQAYFGVGEPNTGQLHLPASANSMLFDSFPDLVMADNPLLGWMDLGQLPM
ncbi:Zn(II)2Cys6 transcription factor [Aspergillus foveolatus]|uniref:Zn(II)2Cys6 transcription factor n=1 Tax=Aspergillus foveolatus TaxID=210207 RepID=UPI003CCCA62E